MDIDSLKTAIKILADYREKTSEYRRLLDYASALYGLPAEILEQLVRCHLADVHSD